MTDKYAEAAYAAHILVPVVKTASWSIMKGIIITWSPCCHTAGEQAAIKTQSTALSTLSDVTAMIDCTRVKLKAPKDDELVFHD